MRNVFRRGIGEDDTRETQLSNWKENCTYESKASNKPNRNQSKFLLSLIPFRAYKADKDQKGSWHTFTLNSGVVKL